MITNGKRQPKQNGSKQKIRELETQVANVEMATRISQMLLRQVLDQFQAVRRDLDNTMGILNDFQYRTQAMLKLGNFNVDELNKLAEEFKLKDYMTASDKEDEVKNYLLDNDGVVTEDSVVIITSKTNGDEDRGIFRSKFTMQECQTETLREKLLGKKVGDVVVEEINGDTHEITILGLRKKQAVEVSEGVDGSADNGN